MGYSRHFENGFESSLEGPPLTALERAFSNGFTGLNNGLRRATSLAVFSVVLGCSPSPEPIDTSPNSDGPGFDSGDARSGDSSLALCTGYEDFDRDDHGNPNSSIEMPCEMLEGADGDYVTNADDCDDTDANINPEGIEVCDSKDNDCNGKIDDRITRFTPGAHPFYSDEDLDGFGSGNPVYACEAPEGKVPQDGDCDDNEYAAYPGAPEICDGVDNDCNGVTDSMGVDVTNFMYMSETAICYPDGQQPNEPSYGLVIPGDIECTTLATTASYEVDLDRPNVALCASISVTGKESESGKAGGGAGLGFVLNTGSAPDVNQCYNAGIITGGDGFGATIGADGVTIVHLENGEPIASFGATLVDGKNHEVTFCLNGTNPDELRFDLSVSVDGTLVLSEDALKPPHPSEFYAVFGASGPNLGISLTTWTTTGVEASCEVR